MVTDVAIFRFRLNPEEREFLHSKFSTETRNDLQDKIKEFLLKPESVKNLTLAEQLKEQQLLSLKLKNQLLLVRDLKYPISKALEIMKDPDSFEAPKLENSSEPALNDNKFKINPHCDDCGHEHYQTGMFNCRECNCGVRG